MNFGTHCPIQKSGPKFSVTISRSARIIFLNVRIATTRSGDMREHLHYSLGYLVPYTVAKQIINLRHLEVEDHFGYRILVPFFLLRRQS